MYFYTIYHNQKYSVDFKEYLSVTISGRCNIKKINESETIDSFNGFLTVDGNCVYIFHEIKAVIDTTRVRFESILCYDNDEEKIEKALYPAIFEIDKTTKKVISVDLRGHEPVCI